VDAKHIWFYSYHHQLKKPHQTLQPKLPYLLIGIMLSKWIDEGLVTLSSGGVSRTIAEPFSSIIKNDYLFPIHIVNEMVKQELHITVINQWEREGYFTIEERRFGTMISRLYHLKPKSESIFKDIKASSSHFEIYSLSKEEERFIAYVLLVGDSQRVFRGGSSREVNRIRNEFLLSDPVYKALHQHFNR